MADNNRSDKWRQFFYQFPKESFQSGTPLIKVDQPISHVIYLKKGYVRQYAVSKEGDEFSLNFYKPGSFFPINLALHDQPNPYYFVSHSSGTFHRIPKQKVVDFLQKNPDALFDLVYRITSGINGMMLRFESIIFGNAQQKVAAALYLSYLRFAASGRGESKLCLNPTKNEALIDLSLTHEQLAFLTGLTRESVSAEMIKLKKEGLINYQRKKICILKPQKIKDLSSLSFYTP